MSDGKSMRASLFLLEREDSPNPDDFTKIVVAATSEKLAREIANSNAGSEGYIWTDGQTVSAREIGLALDGVDGVILSSKE